MQCHLGVMIMLHKQIWLSFRLRRSRHLSRIAFCASPCPFAFYVLTTTTASSTSSASAASAAMPPPQVVLGQFQDQRDPIPQLATKFLTWHRWSWSVLWKKMTNPTWHEYSKTGTCHAFDVTQFDTFPQMNNMTLSQKFVFPFHQFLISKKDIGHIWTRFSRNYSSTAYFFCVSAGKGSSLIPPSVKSVWPRIEVELACSSIPPPSLLPGFVWGSNWMALSQLNKYRVSQKMF